MLAAGLMLLGGLAATGASAGTLDARSATDSGARQLYRLIDQRLSHMREVAAYKWVNGLPVEDLAREAVVLEQAVAAGLNRSIVPETSKSFFLAQIEAAKDIQNHWHERWRREAAPTAAADLSDEIRPELLKLGDRIIGELGAGAFNHDLSAFENQLQVEGLSESRRRAVFDALLSVRRFSDRLTQVQQTGVLRIGTTGDYEPFSLATDAGYRGVDIDLGRDLAAALGVVARFVPTTWPDLLDDLQAGRYDIAMSGVSRTFTRLRKGDLSLPYFTGGKLPIARCADVTRFSSLADIDRRGVRVIVNPGGTNEAFVDAHIHNAEKLLHPDNRTIFAEIVSGAADVMITDQIEVQLQSARHPALCATMTAPLTYQEKGYLIPRDAAWKSFVDTWLAMRRADGTVDAVIARHLEGASY